MDGDMKHILIQDKSFYLTLRRLALPIILQNIVANGLSMMDNIMVGALGEVAISSVTQANQIFFVFSLIIVGLSGGTSVMVSQYWGRRDTKQIGRILGLALMLSVSVGVIFLLGGSIFPESLLAIYTNVPELISGGAGYLRIIAFTFIPYAISFTLLVNLRSVEKPMVALFINIISFFLNTFLNWCLIYGRLGFPQMGVEGAAIATLVSRIVEVIATLCYVFIIDKTLQMKLKNIFRIPAALFRDYCKYAIPVMINETIWGLGYSTFAMILGRMGIESVTAYSVARTMENLMLVFGMGVGSACAVMIGNTLGRGEFAYAKETSRTLQVIASAAGALCGVITILLRPFYFSFYEMSQETRETANLLLIAMAFYLIIKAFNYTMIIGTLRAGGDSRYAMVIDVVFLWTISIPLAAVAGLLLDLPVYLVYCALMVDELIKAGFCVHRFRSGKWMKNITAGQG